MRSDTVAWILVVVLIAWAIRAPIAMRRLRAALDRGDRWRLLRTYRITIGGELLWGVLAIIAAGQRAFTPPPALHVSRVVTDAAVPVAIVIVVGITIATLVARRESELRADIEMAVLLPHSRRERWWFAGVSLAAGTCEELAFRGFAVQLAYGAGLRGWVLLAVVAVGFGLAHLYQGVRGIVSTAVVGLVMTGVFLATGSILAPMIAHVLFDLRAALLPPILPTEPAPGTE